MTTPANDPTDTTDRPASNRGPDVLEWAIRELESVGIPWAVSDAQIILAHPLGLRRDDIRAGAADGVELSEEQLATVLDFVERRKRREPIQFLTGKAFFRQLELAVGPGAYIPRRETEFVAQLAIDALRASGVERPIAIDVGSGVGAIALSMATEVPASTVYAVEIVPETYEWLRRNCEAFAPDNTHPFLGDMADAFPELDGRVDVVAGNPPWIPDGDDSPTPEVALWVGEHHIHGGGSDGMDTMRALSKRALELLKPGGAFVTEHGKSQAARVRALLESDGWLDVRSHVDPTGIERATTARRP